MKLDIDKIKESAFVPASSNEIGAYIYQADIYCPECVLEVMDYQNAIPPNKNTNSVEDYLNEIASDPSYPINREDEHSFDSDIFPKRIWAFELDECGHADRCGGCEVML